MARTVSRAFEEFMRDSVNLNPYITELARRSRDNLLENISEFKEDFFKLHSPYNIHFGSFARKTKCRELDDIDLMIGISAEGATYHTKSWDDVIIYASSESNIQMDCANDDGSLNSTKVSNRFKKKLESVREYSRSEVHRNGEAIKLNLKSKEWSFDIVPCFFTAKEITGRNYYLIPNGKGNWKKTDPRKDRDHVTESNKRKSGYLLELIRLFKKWNKVRCKEAIPSYLLETLIVKFADQQSELNYRIDYRFNDALDYISGAILYSVNDMKEIQGDINSLNMDKRNEIRSIARDDHAIALLGILYDSENKSEEAIKKWGEIFGEEFPKYE